MPIIYLKTEINAHILSVFNLSRSINLHVESMSHTNEKAIGGKTEGFIELGETVTWEAKHLGFKQKLTSKVTQFISPYLFVDEMISGRFKSFKHIHYFEKIENKTIMHDYFIYKSPFKILGKIADNLFLKQYMTNLLKRRNLIIKQKSEKKLTEKFQ